MRQVGGDFGGLSGLHSGGVVLEELVCVGEKLSRANVSP